MSSLHPPGASFAGYPDLPQREREALLRHALDCAECRHRLTRDDPTRAFALLSLRPLPDTLLEQVSRQVGRAVASSAEGPARRRLRGAGWSAIAASLALAAALSVLVPDRPEAPAVLAPHPGAVRAESLMPPAAAQPATIQLLSPQDAEVYDISVGDTRIVMVFDAEIDI